MGESLAYRYSSDASEGSVRELNRFGHVSRFSPSLKDVLGLALGSFFTAAACAMSRLQLLLRLLVLLLES